MKLHSSVNLKISHLLLVLILLTSCGDHDLHLDQLPLRDKHNLQVSGLPPESGFVQKSSDPKALKVLFVGNSVSYRHKLYSLFCLLATHSAHPKALTVGYVMGNNYYLRDHWDAGLATDFIRSKGPWDFIILQEHSSAETLHEESELKYVSAFTQDSKHSGAEPILFETYRLQTAGSDERRESLLRQQKIAKAAGIRIAPVAEAWNMLLQQSRTRLYEPNEMNHPTLKGTYLIACVLYSYLFRESATALPTSYESEDHANPGVVKLFDKYDEARILQETASKVAL